MVSEKVRIRETAEILIIFPVLTLGKEVSGYQNHYWSNHLAKSDDWDRINLGEQSSISQEQQIIQDRGNAGPWWLSYTSVYVAYVRAVNRLCWLYNTLDTLCWTIKCCVSVQGWQGGVMLITPFSWSGYSFWVCLIYSVLISSDRDIQIHHQSRCQMQWVFRIHASYSRLIDCTPV